jgi:hypothetical protein
MSLTVKYVRTFVDGHGVKRETWRSIGIAFKAKNGQPGELDIHLWEVPPFEAYDKTLDTGEVVTEQRIRIMVREPREKEPEAEVSHRFAMVEVKR